jgi:hypothetical protein
MPFGYSFAQDVSLPDTGPVSPNGLSVSAVAPDYFETVGTPIVEGRAFANGDREGSAPVVVVSRHLARQLWPGRSPLGRCLMVGPPPRPCATVIGVAADTHRQRLKESSIPHIYLPAGQESGFGGDALLVRADRGLDAVADAVRRRLVELDDTITLVRTETLRERIDPQLRSWRLGAAIFVFAGVLALLVASAGIYSVLSYLLAARQHEIGVRLALGATGRHVSGLIIRTSLVMALSGIAVGIILAAAMSPRLDRDLPPARRQIACAERARGVRHRDDRRLLGTRQLPRTIDRLRLAQTHAGAGHRRAVRADRAGEHALRAQDECYRCRRIAARDAHRRAGRESGRPRPEVVRARRRRR